MGKVGAQARERNPNWKGGRSVASNGYVLIRVSASHHLADSRGYAYEHRVVAEQKIGRRLLPGEQVHHIDHNKTNNAPGNMEVAVDVAHHRVHHRKGESALRMPGSDNPSVECACGCGEQFEHYDASGRPRMFISGHNRHPAPTLDAVVGVLRDGPRQRGEIALAVGLDVHTVATALSKLRRKGIAFPSQRGTWRLRG